MTELSVDEAPLGWTGSRHRRPPTRPGPNGASVRCGGRQKRSHPALPI